MSVAAAGTELRIGRAAGLRGGWAPPGDKSVSNRAVIFAALADGVTRIDGWHATDDCLATLGVLGRLGVTSRFLNEERTALEVTGRGLGGLTAPATGEPLDCRESGTTMRLMAGVLAGHAFTATLDGRPGLARRPMKRVVEPLRMMGARIDGPDDAARAPLTVTGGSLKGISVELPVASAQVKTALLLAGLMADGVTRVREPAPTRDHTERQLRRFGLAFTAEPDGWLAIEGGRRFAALPTVIPGDPSSAAFMLAAAVMLPRSELTIAGMGINPGRVGLLEVLQKMGARIAVTNQREVGGEPVADLVVRGGATLKAARVAGDLVPRMVDELPILAVVACVAEGVTVIRDAAELRVKESDRIAVMAAELGRLGAKVGVLGDGLAIEGGAALRGAAVDGHGDHRIAMALAVAGLCASGETVIRGAECIAKSYPGFADDLRRLAGGG